MKHNPPYHIVNDLDKYWGPFSTYLDAQMALAISAAYAAPDKWIRCRIVDKKEFKKHLKGDL